MTDDAMTIVIQDGEYLTGNKPIPKPSPHHAETTAEYLLGVVNWVTKWSLDCVEGCK
ncbi:hypothetical protein ABDZ15_08330 [Mycobacterium canetti]|uniref:hypothetical protein n=1 Tax=Mycobacterium canetti TaxID=78331 RepID=UPI0032E4E0E8